MPGREEIPFLRPAGQNADEERHRIFQVGIGRSSIFIYEGEEVARLIFERCKQLLGREELRPMQIIMQVQAQRLNLHKTLQKT